MGPHLPRGNHTAAGWLHRNALGVLRPKVLSNCRQEQHLAYVWDGGSIRDVYEKRPLWEFRCSLILADTHRESVGAMAPAALFLLKSPEDDTSWNSGRGRWAFGGRWRLMEWGFANRSTAAVGALIAAHLKRVGRVIPPVIHSCASPPWGEAR